MFYIKRKLSFVSNIKETDILDVILSMGFKVLSEVETQLCR